MSSKSFARLASMTASTKRSPALSGGKRGEPIENITSLSCTPLDPVDAEIRQRLALDTPHELLQCFVDGGPDIKEGDILVVSGVEYPIRACGDWYWSPDKADYVALVLEDLKK